MKSTFEKYLFLISIIFAFAVILPSCDDQNCDEMHYAECESFKKSLYGEYIGKVYWTKYVNGVIDLTDTVGLDLLFNDTIFKISYGGKYYFDCGTNNIIITSLTNPKTNSIIYSKNVIHVDKVTDHKLFLTSKDVYEFDSTIYISNYEFVRFK